MSDADRTHLCPEQLPADRVMPLPGEADGLATLPTDHPDGRRAPAPAGVPAALAGHPRYRVLGLLGAGGMGTVYRAEHLFMERPVALKVVHPALVGNAAAVERFHREVKAAARLDHPNIVRAHDAEQAGDLHFLVMEHVEGTSLARLVAERGPLPVRLACEYVRQAALGLQHAYEKGMVHCDIKPHNLMLTPQGVVKVLDFGLARFARESAPAAPLTEAASQVAPTASLTGVGAVMGTPDYLAPEQARDPHVADIRADVYSLGCTLYFLLAGRVPFPDNTVLDKLTAHASRKPPPLTEVRKAIPAGLARVVDRMTAKDPALRYQTPAEAARALAPFAAAGSPSRTRRAAVAAAVLVGAVGLTGYWFGPALYRTATGPASDKDNVLAAPGDEVRRLTGHLGAVRTVAFSADGRRALTGSNDRTVRLWDLESGENLQLFMGHRDRVVCAALSPDGRRVVSGGWHDTVRVWDVASGRELRNFPVAFGVVWSVAFSPDGRRALAGTGGVILSDDPARFRASPTFREADFAKNGDSKLHRWDLEAAPPRLILAGDPAIKLDPFGRVVGAEETRAGESWPVVHRGSISPDGRRLVTGGWDGWVRLWDAETGKGLRGFAGHQGEVRAVTCCSDAGLVLSGGDDQTVRLWDMATGQELRRFTGHSGSVLSVAFSPDGRRALSGGEDRTVRLWQLPAPPR